MNGNNRTTDRRDERIKTLLTSTDLTFKQIIEQLKKENIPASLNTIRRVNRNNIFRKPRYDSKLTEQQRDELISILKRTAKPNLTALAKHFNVSHGSVWYWWDKLGSNVTAKRKQQLRAGLRLPKTRPTYNNNSNNNNDSYTDQLSPNVGWSLDYDDNTDPLDLDDEDLVDDRPPSSSGGGRTSEMQYSPYAEEEEEEVEEAIESGHEDQLDGGTPTDGIRPLDNHELVGPVLARDTSGEFINLPILMYAPISYSSPSTSSNSHS